MAKMNVICVAAVSGLLLLAPGTILAGSARTHEQQKQANEAYKALSAGELQSSVTLPAVAPPAVSAQRDDSEVRIWPGVPGIAPPQRMVGKPQPEQLWY